MFLLQNCCSFQQQPMPSAGFSSGADTTSAPEEKIGVQGNWVKKKDWVIKLNEVNTEIQNLSVSVSGYKKSFNNKFFTADGMLESFYKDLGQQQGKIEELFDGVMRHLEHKKKRDIEQLTPQSEAPEQSANRERLIKIEVVEQRVNALKSDLEQLKLDIKSIEEIGSSMDDRMKRVDEAIKTAVDEAASAQKITDDAWQIIDDKKVRLSYYELRGRSLEKIKNIENYLRDDLSKDFDDVTNTIKTQIEKIHASIKQLEDKGLFIKHRAQRIEDVKQKQLSDFKEKQKADEAKRQRLASMKRTELAKPWYHRWYNLFVKVINRTINYVRGLFGTKPEAKKVKKQEKPINQQATPPAQLPSSSSLPKPQEQNLPPQKPFPMMPLR